MDERIIDAAAGVLGCTYDEAEKFLENECGSYASIGGEQVWVSGTLVYSIASAAVSYVENT